jgi:hypothetical protein
VSDVGLKNYLQARVQLNRSFSNPRQVNNLFRAWRKEKKNRPLTMDEVLIIWGDEQMWPLAFVLSRAEELGLLKHVYIVNGVPFSLFSHIPSFASREDIGSYYLMVRAY